jgi:hypothetical protein
LGAGTTKAAQAAFNLTLFPKQQELRMTIERKRIAAIQIAVARIFVGGGECRTGCISKKTKKPRKVAAGSWSGLCSTCLSNIGRKRHMSHADRLIADRELDVRKRRLVEAETHPKGYRLRPTAKDAKVVHSAQVIAAQSKARKKSNGTLSTTARKRIARNTAKVHAQTLRSAA